MHSLDESSEAEVIGSSFWGAATENSNSPRQRRASPPLRDSGSHQKKHPMFAAPFKEGQLPCSLLPYLPANYIDEYGP